jgi:hypothetical protein
MDGKKTVLKREFSGYWKGNAGLICGQLKYSKMMKTIKLTTAMLLLIRFLIPVTVLGQVNDEIKVVSSDFGIVFKNDDDKTDFKKLRNYLKEKEAKRAELENELDNHYDPSETIIKLKDDSSALDHIVKGKKGETTISVKIGLLDPFSSKTYRPRIVQQDSVLTVEKAKEAIGQYAENIAKLMADKNIIDILNKSIKNVKEDIDKCTAQIDSALAPEYQQQDFRKIISIYFAILIAMLVGAFFTIVYKKSDNNLSKDLLGGNGLQFVTLFVLIIAVILFGILNILKSSELAAILSGISGYILGKGTQKDLSTILTNQNTLPSAPVVTPPPDLVKPAAGG